MTLEGDFFTKFDAAGKDILSGSKKGLKLSAGKVGSLSVAKTPVETANLRRSEYETEVEEDGGNLIIEIGYKADYAPPVHEITTNKHAVGEAKFLENAVKEFSSSFLEAIKKQIKL